MQLVQRLELELGPRLPAAKVLPEVKVEREASHLLRLFSQSYRTCFSWREGHLHDDGPNTREATRTQARVVLHKDCNCKGLTVRVSHVRMLTCPVVVSPRPLRLATTKMAAAGGGLEQWWRDIPFLTRVCRYRR